MHPTWQGLDGGDPAFIQYHSFGPWPFSSIQASSATHGVVECL